jgi:phosphoenolpyruvate carboxykinase (GTP)
MSLLQKTDLSLSHRYAFTRNLSDSYVTLMTLQRSDVVRINQSLVNWVDEIAAKTKPDSIHWCDGTEEECASLIDQMLNNGQLIRLDKGKLPNCYLFRSSPNDVARTEASTFICTKDKSDAGPTNNWMETLEAEKTLAPIFANCMKGRTMYVVPYLMGPVGSPYSQVGVELTDSQYVVVSLRIMTRVGTIALAQIREDRFVKGVHSMGNLDPRQKYICHFPESQTIMSINSNYGGNALLSKKSHSLRIASVLARNEDWMAEHMLILGFQDADGEVTYMTGAFPSASGKTNLAMLKPPKEFDKFKVLAVGDDIAWLHLGSEQKIFAINPEAGFFCVAPHTSPTTNPNLIDCIRENTIFTNVALASDNTPWWEGKGPVPESLVDWQGREWVPGNNTPAAHPNSRFTVSVSQFPSLSPNYEDPNGVPISAILFGGRRASLIPLVFEALSWEHGILMGAMMKVETTAAAEGAVGVLRNDPMAMTPFCGYNMADYFQHWLDFSKKSWDLPKIFQVNWFRIGKGNKFLWPGYGQNIRVLKWISDRIKGKADAIKTPIGYIPSPNAIDTGGLSLVDGAMDELLRVDKEGWLEELKSTEAYFRTFGDKFPKALWKEYKELTERLRE